jgi:hypothetical protein
LVRVVTRSVLMRITVFVLKEVICTILLLLQCACYLNAAKAFDNILKFLDFTREIIIRECSEFLVRLIKILVWYSNICTLEQYRVLQF